MRRPTSPVSARRRRSRHADARWSPRILPGVCQRAGRRRGRDARRGNAAARPRHALARLFRRRRACPARIPNGFNCPAGRVERFATAMTGELFEVSAQPFRAAPFPERAAARSQSRRGLPAGLAHRHRGAARAVCDTVQGARGVPAVGTHAGLVRGLSLRPADRRGDRRPARLDRQRRGGDCRHGRACCRSMPAAFAMLGRQGAHHR